MKKFRKTAAALVLTAALAGSMLSVNVLAVPEEFYAEAQLAPNLTINIDGRSRTFFDVSGTEVHPILYNGTTYLPVRAIGELMDKNVNWDQSTLTVTLAGSRQTGTVTGNEDAGAQEQEISVQIRPDFSIIVEGVKQSFADVNGDAVYPLLYNGSTYLPLRAIGNIMNKNVAWDGDTKTVSLYGTLSEGQLVTDADTFEPSGNSQGNGNNIQQTPDGVITLDEASGIALNHAGLSGDAVRFVKQKMERERQGFVYEIEFVTADGNEYDYEINAQTGEIISYDFDAEYYGGGSGQTDFGRVDITEDQAREIALSKAPGATQEDIVKLKLDRDDGRMVYDVKIIYGEREYDIEIDAQTGNVLETDVESIYD